MNESTDGSNTRGPRDEKNIADFYDCLSDCLEDLRGISRAMASAYGHVVFISALTHLAGETLNTDLASDIYDREQARLVLRQIESLAFGKHPSAPHVAPFHLRFFAKPQQLVLSATDRAPFVGQLFVSEWKHPWSSRRRRGHTSVTVEHRQLAMCKVTRIDEHLLDYEVVVILEESGRPPEGAHDVGGGAVSLSAIQEGRVLLTPPTEHQLAMLPSTALGIGAALEQPEYQIPTAYASRGMTLIHTGGGCTGLMLEFACGLYALVTSAEDAAAPTTDDEPVDVGVNDDETGLSLEFRSCPNARAAISYLDELSAKYSPHDLSDPTVLANETLDAALFHVMQSFGTSRDDGVTAFSSEGRERIVSLLQRYAQSIIYARLRRRGVIPGA
jgi:hypothetical protein